MKFNIHCRFSGLLIGTLDYELLAGYQPYLSHWKEMQAMHPAFSMPTGRLLAFTRSTYEALLARSEDGEATHGENALLQVSWLATLHSLGSIRQEAIALPTIGTVHRTMKKLVALAYWHHVLDSKRFAFPEFKVNRTNSNGRFENIDHYLDACFAIKDDYDKGIKDLDESERKAAADRALAKLRDNWLVPVSKKALWAWVRAHLPASYEADAQGWMSTLFLGNERTICDFDPDEVDLMDQIICGECPAGTGVLKAVRGRIEEVRKIITDKREAFSIDLTEFLPDAAQVVAAPEPVRKDFDKESQYIKARALWWLAQSEDKRKQGL